MLFSEPKIPQCVRIRIYFPLDLRFSALQRAENSSIERARRRNLRSAPFQCSSASRKFLNLICMRSVDVIDVVSVLFSEPKIPQWSPRSSTTKYSSGFSALQRAENSSIFERRLRVVPRLEFQCSSASRKFLNFDIVTDYAEAVARFSALQRAENSSMHSAPLKREE